MKRVPTAELPLSIERGPTKEIWSFTGAIVRDTTGLVAGKVFVTAAGFTVDTGSAADTTYYVYNDSGVAITLTQGVGLTLRVQGTATTGNYSLAQRGFIRLWFVSTTEAVIC